MRLKSTLLLGLGGSVLLAGNVMAADIILPVIPVVVPAEPEPRCEIDGYVEVFGAYDRGTEIEYEDLQGTPPPPLVEDWVGFGFGGAGRASLSCNPRFSIQLDAWGEYWFGTWDDGFEDGEWDETWVGIGTHLTYRSPGGFFVGPLVSIGGFAGWGVFGNVGLEAGFSTTMLRVQAQAGYTVGLTSNAAAEDATDWYVQAVVAFYPTPHFSITGNVGYDVYFDNDPWMERELNWGARVEFQPPALPVSFFVGYQGWYWAGTDGGVLFRQGIEHVFGAGIRFLVGEPDLRSLDDAVGLMDYNAIYRQTFIH